MSFVRDEIMLYLQELEAADPRPIWQKEREQGLVSGIDQVFHFFFDDHVFDEAEIGRVFHDHGELTAIKKLKRALEAVLESVGDAGDDEFVEHPLWKQVTEAAATAMAQMNT